jgi:DNA-binding transcriptional LysR family regulator
MKNVTLRQLKIFEAVARHLSFSRAAEELHLTQPAVSMQVQALEDLAGLPLTEQAGKKVRLTAAGEEIARQARRIAEQLREAGEAMAALKGVESGRLKIGVVSTAKYFAPSLLAEYRRRHPGVELELTVNNRGAIVRHLAENGIDLAIMGTPPAEFETVAKVFRRAPPGIHRRAGPPAGGQAAHRPAATRRRDPADSRTRFGHARGTGTLSRATQGTRRGDDGTGQQRDHQAGRDGGPRPVLHLGTYHRLERSVGRLVVLDIRDTPVKRQWRLVYRTDKRLMPAATAFVEFMDGEGSRLIEARSAGMSGAPQKPRRKRPGPPAGSPAERMGGGYFFAATFHSAAVTPSLVTKALTW